MQSVPKKLLVVQNNSLAQLVSPIMGTDWSVTSLGTELAGTGFALILVMSPGIDATDSHMEQESCRKYIEMLKLKLYPEGQLIVL